MRSRPSSTTLLARGTLHEAGSFAIPGVGDRRVTVYLPPGYGSSGARYPVAYMFDGQNVFGDAGSYAGGWRLHELMDKRAARKKGGAAIVVGVHHGGVARAADLAPWPVRGQKSNADALLDWLAGTLKAKVDAELRTLPGVADTVVGGSSLGGLTALYALFKHPGTFGKALSMSPALWVGGGAIFRFVEGAPLPWNPRLYLDCGVREGRGFAHAQALGMAQLLARRGFVPDHHLLWRSDPRGAHSERTWRRRLPRAVNFLLG